MRKTKHVAYYCIGLILGLTLVIPAFSIASDKSRTGRSQAESPLERFILETKKNSTPVLPKPNKQSIAMLHKKKEQGEMDHLHLLVEYGLLIHWHNLQWTQLSRVLPVKDNLLLAELIRILNIPECQTAHECGWLNRQFYGNYDEKTDEYTPFDGNFTQPIGWSSYQVYLWVKEHTPDILSDGSTYPNWERIGELIKKIDNSPLNGVGGADVCHYGCQ